MKDYVSQLEKLGELEKIVEISALYSQNTFETRWGLPQPFVQLIERYGYCGFQGIAMFPAPTSIPIADKEGRIVMGMFYGWGKSEYSIPAILEDLRGQIPDHLLPFSEGAEGDHLLVELTSNGLGQVYYWHHESLEGQELYLLAHKLELFFAGLVLIEADEEDDDLVEEWFADDF